MLEIVPDNRNYKDSVFVDLFSTDEKAKERFLSLYNALHGTQLHDVTLLENIKLEQVMYMSFANDVSYLVENKIIFLIEHQSTINPNMPLRCLEYVSRLYEKLFESKEKYSRKLLNIPTPEFYVFYNGIEPYPCNKTLKLSHAFIELTEQPNLELIVKIVNINQHNEHPLLETCKPINEYSIFVQTVREWKAVDPVHGFQKAVEECIANNILREYLERKAKEVINMLLAEYNYEEDIAVQRAEERELAFAEGIEQGRSEGIEQGRSEGIEQGSHKKAVESARVLKQLHCDTAMIMQVTGLSAEEIETL